MLRSADFAHINHEYISGHPVAKSITVLTKYLPQIWYAINENTGLIPIGDETHKLISELNRANLGSYVPKNFMISNDVVQTLRQFEKQSISSVRISHIQDAIEQLYEALDEYFNEKNSDSIDVENRLNDIENHTRDLAYTLSNYCFTYGSQISVRLQSYTLLSKKVEKVKKAIAYGWDIYEVLHTLNAENLRTKAGGDPIVRSIFEEYLFKVVVDCQGGLMYALEQLKSAQLKWESELREKKRLNGTVDAFYAYFASGKVITLNEISLSDSPQTLSPTPPIKLSGYFDFSQDKQDYDLLDYAARCAEEHAPKQNLSQRSYKPREIQDIEDYDQTMIVECSDIEVCLHYFFDALEQTNNLHYIGGAQMYELIEVAKYEEKICLKTWLESIILFKHIDKDGENKYKDFELSYVGEVNEIFNGNFDIYDVLLYRKDMGEPT